MIQFIADTRILLPESIFGDLSGVYITHMLFSVGDKIPKSVKENSIKLIISKSETHPVLTVVSDRTIFPAIIMKDRISSKDTDTIVLYANMMDELVDAAAMYLSPDTNLPFAIADEDDDMITNKMLFDCIKEMKNPWDIVFLINANPFLNMIKKEALVK